MHVREHSAYLEDSNQAFLISFYRMLPVLSSPIEKRPHLPMKGLKRRSAASAATAALLAELSSPYGEKLTLVASPGRARQVVRGPTASPRVLPPLSALGVRTLTDWA
jgi:hypothetical protein